MKERFIFDLDGTLLNANFEKEDKFFESVFSKDELEMFLPNKCTLLNEYETLFPRYDVGLLSKFMRARTGVEFTEDVVTRWVQTNATFDDTLVDGVVEVLEYLKSNDKSLVILTNWFSEGQIARLSNAGLLQYFDDVIGGEYSLKPNRASYYRAADKYDIGSCVMIGDTYEKDVLGPRMFGMEAVYFNEKCKTNCNGEEGIKKMIKIKEMY